MKRRMFLFGWTSLTAVCLLLMSLAAAAHAASPKYVFLFIGDGMGIPQRAAAEAYTGRKLVMDTLPAQGITTTYANDRYITGSAAAATALSAGCKTNIGYIGMNPDLKPVKTIAEMAHDRGMKVGIVSSVSIDHATPAAFYAHVPSRSMYHEIDHALAESGFEYFAGGGLKDPEGKKSKKPLGDAVALAKKNGYTFVNDKKAFEALRPGSGKVVAINAWLQDSKALPYAMDTTDKDISLAEFTSKGIQLLDNPKGFFMMVEGGKIDWACHANDAAAALSDNLAFDAAVAKAVDFAKTHPDETLIVVTGDHECGGLTLGFAGTQYASYFDVLKHQNVSFQKFTDEVLPAYMKSGNPTFAGVEPLLTKCFGLQFSGDDHMAVTPDELAQLQAAFERSRQGDTFKPEGAMYLLYGEYDPLAVAVTHILDGKAGLGWTTYQHTGVPVSTSALGVGSAAFNGAYDNTDVAKRMMGILGMQPELAEGAAAPARSLALQ